MNMGSQLFKNVVFSGPSVLIAQCIIRTERFPDAGKSCDYNEDKFSTFLENLYDVSHIQVKVASPSHMTFKEVLDLWNLVKLICFRYSLPKGLYFSQLITIFFSKTLFLVGITLTGFVLVLTI